MSDTSIYAPTRSFDPQQMALLQQLQLQPEWSISQQQFQPLDSGYQRDQINYMDNVLNTMADPLFAILTGNFSPAAFEPSYEEEVIDEGVTEGADYLNAVLQSTPDSIDGQIARLLTEGMAPREAVDLLVQSGRIPVKNEAGEDDTSTRDHYYKWAQDAWDRKLSDRPAQTQMKATPSPWMERAQNLGIGDPTEQYKADHFATARTGELMSQAEAARLALERANAEFLGAQTAQNRDPLIPAHRPSESRRSPGQSAAARGRDRREQMGSPQPAEAFGFAPAWGSVFGGGHPQAGGAPFAVSNQGGRARPVNTQGPRESDRVRSARVQRSGATVNNQRAQQSAMVDQARRQAMADFLARQGRTPSVDLLMSRMGSIPGMG